MIKIIIQQVVAVIVAVMIIKVLVMLIVIPTEAFSKLHFNNYE